MKPSSNLSIEACRREGQACQLLYGSDNNAIDTWAADRKAQGDTVSFYTDCQGVCNEADRSVTSTDGGVTGLKVTGELSRGSLNDVSAIAVTVGGLSKIRLINPQNKPLK